MDIDNTERRMRADSRIQRLHPEDAASLIALRRRALLSDPLAFGASIDDDRGLSLDFVRTVLADQQEQAVFGAFDGADLVGMVGVLRASAVKRRHQAIVWGMYVAPQARQKGAGRALLAAVIEHALGWPDIGQLQLSVTETAVAARRLYEAAVFCSWGRAARALQWEGRFVDEIHLVLELAAR